MNNHNLIIEEKATFRVGNAFYRPQSKVTRDLGVLAATIYKHKHGQLRVLDAMTGCGIRALRYYLESGADEILVNDSNLDIKPILEDNLQDILFLNKVKISYKNANHIFFECYNNKDYYDLVDVDGFGSPSPYLSTMLWATKIGGLVYLTSTDGRTGTGHLPEKSLQVYGSYARSHPACQEQVLRLLIGSVLQQAATMELGIKPIFSLFTGQTYRVMLQLLNKSNLTLDNYGFIGYCHECGHYKRISWHQLGKVQCVQEKNINPYVISGPMWLGNLHDRDYLGEMKTLAKEWRWLKRVELLSVMENELDFPPYFYTLGEIGKRGKLDVPKRSQLIQSLNDQGYRAAPTHINAEAIKTNADLNICIEFSNAISRQKTL
ncbi:tRNA (guanine-N1)-methyltransferase [Aphanothece sacrum]|uniref:tRNA (Guanine-N1)-methyltransferase n=1 Tax=Aphanothece sacrum FPU1 TaxID=1920663 RepID=A0A401IN09_APHSA|nr:tRNA (guanine-N1)-methyltransferase [Aphanothece sacrum]GBF82633.1 tRNA (guanine-N1)-methyltransferase [Aphanothece sacrum FPU1]GBF86186.1 tRNA (guanine-N1)-methyltransferase [Aphanothece sacrum FPU3]